MKSYLSICCVLLAATLHAQDSSDHYHWNNLHETWEKNSRRYYTYYPESTFPGGKKSQTILERDANSFLLLRRENFAYDSTSGKILTYNLELFDTSAGVFVPSFREVYSYDGKDNRLNRREFKYDKQNGVWNFITGDSFAYTFEADTIISYVIHQLTDPSPAIPIQRLLFYDFNTNKEPSVLIVESWTGSSFDPYIKLEDISWGLGYDPLNIEPATYKGYLYGSSSWVPSVYDTSIFSGSNRIKRYLYYWNGINLDSNIYDKFEYDNAGLLFKTLNYEYSGSWKQSDGLLDSNVYGSFNEVRENIRASWSGSWLNESRTVYYYHGLGIEEKNRSRFIVYPNPSANELIIEPDPFMIKKVNIYDAGGRFLCAKAITEGRVNISDLEAGNYFLLLTGEAGEITIRFIKQR